MSLHLREIGTQVAADGHAVVVLDGAAWHKSNTLAVPDNISLLFLPPYSPELNPVERVWHYLRSHWLANRVFADYEAIVDACAHAWCNFAQDGSLIKSLCQTHWAVLQETF